jgi:hypothetical protein
MLPEGRVKTRRVGCDCPASQIPKSPSFSWRGARAISGRGRSTTLAGMERSAPDLEAVTARLERIAAELDSDPEEDRATELVREASELASQAGRAVESALQAAAESRDA